MEDTRTEGGQEPAATTEERETQDDSAQTSEQQQQNEQQTFGREYVESLRRDIAAQRTAKNTAKTELDAAKTELTTAREALAAKAAELDTALERLRSWQDTKARTDATTALDAAGVIDPDLAYSLISAKIEFDPAGTEATNIAALVEEFVSAHPKLVAPAKRLPDTKPTAPAPKDAKRDIEDAKLSPMDRLKLGFSKG